jgi:hypothetical protein
MLCEAFSFEVYSIAFSDFILYFKIANGNKINSTGTTSSAVQNTWTLQKERLHHFTDATHLVEKEGL